jgi:hypothetical protein
MRTHPLPFLLGLALCAAPPSVGKPCLFTTYFAEWRCFPAILRDGAGNLTCGEHLLNLGGLTQAPAAAGDPTATAMLAQSSDQPRFYFTYRDPEGGVQTLWFTRLREHDEWHHLQLTQGGATGAPQAAGDPSTLSVDNVFHATYRDRAGGLVDVARTRGQWTFTRLIAKGLPPAAGDPVQTLVNGVRHIVYRDGEGGLHDLRFEGAWRTQRLNLGGALSAPAALGQPALLAEGSVLHVVYRDLAGNLRDLTYNGTWQPRRLNRGGLTPAAEAAGDPAVASVDGVLHIAYRDLEGRLEDVWYDGAWHRQILNHGGATDAPLAAEDPGAPQPVVPGQLCG